MLNQNLSSNTIEWGLDPSAQTNIKTEIRNIREMADGLQVWIFAPQIFPELSKWMSINFPCEARNKITPFASTLHKYLQTHPQKQIPCRWLHLFAIVHACSWLFYTTDFNSENLSILALLIHSPRLCHNLMFDKIMHCVLQSKRWILTQGWNNGQLPTSSKVNKLLTNRLELSFLRVLALPKASRIGFVCKISSSSPPPPPRAAKYCMAILAVSVFPAPLSPLKHNL